LGAYRRPGAVLLLYAFRVASSVWVASHASALVQTVVAGYARGDLVLFEPGGVMFVEVLRLVEPQLSRLGVAATAAFVAVAFVELVPTAMVLVALGRRGRVSFTELAHHALDSIGTLALLQGLAFAAQALIVVLFAALASIALAWLLASGPLAGAACVVAALVGSCGVVALRLVHDLARAAAVDGARGLYDAGRCALRVVTWRAAWSYLWRGALACAALVVAAVVGSPANWAMSTAVHAVALLVVVYLRVDWLAVALLTVRRSELAES
jgi:hypothetical protein